MANILYGINGEGSGHWTRSKEVIEHLKERGHNITIVTSGRAYTNLNGQYDVEKIYGFRFVYTKGKVNELATFFTNMDFVPGAAKSLKKVFKIIKDKKIDLIITDFEPISCSASNLINIPAISIDNQHFITNTDALRPGGYKNQEDLAKAMIVIRTMTPFAEAYLTISFFDAKPKNKKTIIVPPIVRREFFEAKASYGEYFIVYLTHSFGAISKILRSVDHNFVFYGADKAEQDGNILFKKFDQKEFIKDLAGAGGVLATSGFSLISEALYLKKPYLAWPAKKQFEQTFNAYHLEKRGYGKYADDLNTETINDFISNLKTYRENLASYPYKDNELLFAKLDELIKKMV